MFLRSSTTVVYAAIAGNFAIAVTKFGAAALSGSAAMLSEGVHSLVDTGNGLLMLYGIRRSSKPADAAHPFGRGKELYFWTLIVAILVFAIGGGISIYGGIASMLHPEPLRNPAWNYGVLGVATLFEGITWTIAHREFRKVKGRLGYWEALQTSKDPTTMTVLVEDTAAMLGVAIAFVGIFLAHAFDMPALDGAAAILIGVILATVGSLLAYKCKGLLIGEGVEPETLASIRAIAESDPAVARLARALTMHFGPQEVLLTMEIQFQSDLSAGEVAGAIERLDHAIRSRHPEVRLIFLESQSIAMLTRKGASAGVASDRDWRSSGSSTTGS
jgi:cation diffusion facilitator family transporter